MGLQKPAELSGALSLLSLHAVPSIGTPLRWQNPWRCISSLVGGFCRIVDGVLSVSLGSL